MKKKILAVALVLTLCFGMTGCVSTGSKNYNESSKLISIEGENDLYYYSTTHIVYIVFNEFECQVGYGYKISNFNYLFCISYAPMILIQNR